MTKYRKTMSEAYQEVNLQKEKKYIITPGGFPLLLEDNMDLMKKAAGGAMQTIKLKDGKLKMDSFTASAIMAVHKAVNDKNKKSIEQMINTGTKAQIMKLQSLAMKQIKSGDELEHDGEELDEKFDVKTAATKKGKISVSSFDNLKDAEKHLAGMEKKGHKGIISKDGKPVFRGTPAEIKKQMKAHKKKHDKIGIGEDMTVTGSTDGSISQRDLDHVQKELRRLGIKDAVVDQNEMDKDKIDVKTKMSNDKVKKAFDKSKITVTYEHVQMEGTWHTPKTPKEKAGLKKLLKKPVIFGKDGDDAIDAISDYIGDDQLYDDLHIAGKKDPKGDARSIIRDRMYDLLIKEETESLEETVTNIMNEGKMSEIDAMHKDGKSAEEIAKAMKMPVKSIKKILGEASARADAMRAMRQGKKVDPADVDNTATDDDVKAASKNIIMQMRKVISLRGNFKVEFGDKKKMKIDPKIAAAVQDKYDSMRKADDKEKFQAKVAKSYKDMLSALKENVNEDKDELDKVKTQTFKDKIKNAKAKAAATPRGTPAHDDALDAVKNAKDAEKKYKEKTTWGRVKAKAKSLAKGAALVGVATAKLGDSFDPTLNKREAILDRIDRKLQEKKDG